MDLFNSVLPMLQGGTASGNTYMTALTSFIAIILAFVVLIDLAVEKGREPTDKNRLVLWK